VKLNQNERTVLYGLVRYPGASDLELSELIDVKRPTITKIRNKLFDTGMVQTHYVPNFQTLGMEMMVFWWSRFNASLNPVTEGSEATLYPYNVLMVRTRLEGMGVAAFHDFTSYRLHTVEKVVGLIRSGTLKRIDDIKVSFHPFDTNHIDSYFDYAPTVDLLLDLGRDDCREAVEYPKRSCPGLSEKEKAILATMVANPQLSDSKLSALMGISRPTISEKRNTFIQRRLITRRNISRVRPLGAEMVGLYTFTMEPRGSDAQVHKAAAEIASFFRPFIQMHGRLECTGMFIARSFEEYRRWHDEHLLRLVEERRVCDDLRILLMPINNVQTRLMNFAPAVRYALDLPQEK